PEAASEAQIWRLGRPAADPAQIKCLRCAPHRQVVTRRRRPAAVRLGAEVIEHEQTDGGRQVAVLALGVDRVNETGQARVAATGDLLQPFPERILKADAGLVAGNDHRAFENRRLHSRLLLLADMVPDYFSEQRAFRPAR